MAHGPEEEKLPTEEDMEELVTEFFKLPPGEIEEDLEASPEDA